MSRIFEALQHAKAEPGRFEVEAPPAVPMPAPPPQGCTDPLHLDGVSSFSIVTSPEHHLVLITDENHLGAEKIRVLSTRLRRLQQTRRLKKILVTSSISDEGKSVIAANLALALASRARQGALVIGGDLRRPSLGKMFGTSNAPGLTDWWQGETIGNCLRRAEGTSLWFLPSGRPVEQPLEMLESQRLADLMAQLGELFDWIIIDSPPLAAMADSGVWLHLVDGALLVTRAARTPKKLLAKLLESTEVSKLLGIVLNESPDVEQRYYEDYGYHTSKKRQAGVRRS